MAAATEKGEMTDKIDWSKAPEGATHYAIENNHVTWLLMGGDSLWRVLHKKRWILASGLPRGVVKIPKRITQAVFNGLPSEYRWAAVDRFGCVLGYENKPDCGHFTWSGRIGNPVDIGSGYDATDWQNSLIERQESITDVARSIEAARIEERDAVNNPPHYTTGGIECIDAMQAMLSREEFIGYLRGNIFKYQWRYKHKNGVEDLRKADWYAQRLVELEAENAARTSCNAIKGVLDSEVLRYE